jgi:hypothetical protein
MGAKGKAVSRAMERECKNTIKRCNKGKDKKQCKGHISRDARIQEGPKGSKSPFVTDVRIHCFLENDNMFYLTAPVDFILSVVLRIHWDFLTLSSRCHNRSCFLDKRGHLKEY